MDAAVRVPLPGGLWHGGNRIGELTLRAVGREDEGFLLESGDGSPPSERATALLARCLTGFDGSEAVARGLTVGDREALLLHLRRLTFGDTAESVLRCPRAECRELLELTLSVSDLLMPPYDDARPTYDVAFGLAGLQYEVTFRLPTADDLGNVAAISAGDPDAGALELMRRCVARVTAGGATANVEALDEAARAAIAAAMVERDPQAEIELELRCAACGCEFAVIFDTAAFLLQELEERAKCLTHEVHTLASHYHWGEREILELSPGRRARYLDLVAGGADRTRSR